MTALSDRTRAVLRRLEGLSSPRVAEVGVMDAKLSRALLEGHSGLSLVMVDNWLPEGGQSDGYKATGDVNARLSPERVAAHEAKARALVREFNGRAGVVKADSVEAARQFPPLAFDLVFLDGDHSYDGVKRDIGAWAPLARHWLGGHDYANPDARFDFTGVKRAVDETFGERVQLDSNLTWWVPVDI